LRQEVHGEAGVLRKMGEGMHKNIEVSTVSWSVGNIKYSPQKGRYDPVDPKRALGWARRWPESGLEGGC
jgi:hypothetical protein